MLCLFAVKNISHRLKLAVDQDSSKAHIWRHEKEWNQDIVFRSPHWDPLGRQKYTELLFPSILFLQMRNFDVLCYKSVTVFCCFVHYSYRSTGTTRSCTITSVRRPHRCMGWWPWLCLSRWVTSPDCLDKFTTDAFPSLSTVWLS